jgi:hypothetical protein
MLCLYLMYCDTCCEDLYLKYKLLSYMLLYMAYTIPKSETEAIALFGKLLWFITCHNYP